MQFLSVKKCKLELLALTWILVWNCLWAEFRMRELGLFVRQQRTHYDSCTAAATQLSSPLNISQWWFKHRKNRECCPLSLLIVRTQWLPWIKVLGSKIDDKGGLDNTSNSTMFLQSTKIALTMHHAVDIIYPVLQLVQRIHDKGGGLSSVSHKQWIFQEENYWEAPKQHFCRTKSVKVNVYCFRKERQKLWHGASHLNIFLLLSLVLSWQMLTSSVIQITSFNNELISATVEQ